MADIDSGQACEGGCHCGAVRYRVVGPLQFQFLCHCDNCRRINGGMRLAGASASADALEVTGKPSQYTYPGGKAPIELHFCGTCGTHLYAFPTTYEGVVVLRAGTFDRSEAFAPIKSIFTDSACAWEKLL